MMASIPAGQRTSHRGGENTSNATVTPTIMIDTREQTPFTFANMAAKLGTLDTGDYSIEGLTHLIAIERKSLQDLLGCVGRDRDRFKRELQRLRAYPYRLLVIEASAFEIASGDWRGKLTPSHVLGSLSAWTAQYGLPIWLGGSHSECGRFVEKYLFQAARVIAGTYEAAAGVSQPRRTDRTIPLERS